MILASRLFPASTQPSSCSNDMRPGVEVVFVAEAASCRDNLLMETVIPTPVPEDEH